MPESTLTLRVELIPTLTRCIQATAKGAFSAALDRYLRGGEEEGELGERIEILRLFLESADFAALRKESEEQLVAGKTVRFLLSREVGELHCEMVVDEAGEAGG